MWVKRENEARFLHQNEVKLARQRNKMAANLENEARFLHQNEVKLARQRNKMAANLDLFRMHRLPKAVSIRFHPLKPPFFRSAVAASKNMALVGWCTVGSKSGFSGWNRMLTAQSKHKIILAVSHFRQQQTKVHWFSNKSLLLRNRSPLRAPVKKQYLKFILT